MPAIFSNSEETILPGDGPFRKHWFSISIAGSRFLSTRPVTAMSDETFDISEVFWGHRSHHITTCVNAPDRISLLCHRISVERSTPVCSAYRLSVFEQTAWLVITPGKKSLETEVLFVRAAVACKQAKKTNSLYKKYSSGPLACTRFA